ncbi:hypothetical protein BC938DRAFT_475208 [Jimgerdemannia flammicorona]|uniref:Uncharacterized protein n=1 Tax=Jimgerdemannia flammicorona TaxID=994334 RepID=A0A433QRW4_9FUNG|nr:hypothetical protein BC938DRAFT_475208 [Jimgerdemannia flammicorona]
MDGQHNKPNFVPQSDNLPEAFKLQTDCKSTTKPYLLPRNDTEFNRLHIQHYVTRQMLHGTFNTPLEEDLENGIRVLDAGCGTVLSVFASYGIDIAYVREFGRLLSDNGFSDDDIVEDYVSVPLGWGGRAGDLWAENAYMGWIGLAPKLLPLLGISYDVLIQEIKMEFEQFKQNKTWLNFCPEAIAVLSAWGIKFYKNMSLNTWRRSRIYSNT